MAGLTPPALPQRDAEHRESLSSTLRTLHADIQRQTTDSARQTEKLSDAQRRLDIADATERALRIQLKTAEQGIHKLKDEVAKMKSLVAQSRSACANEVRKRDRQIDNLKKAAADAGRVRGGGRNRDVITINITGKFDAEGDHSMGMPVGATADEGYSLRMETNGFLTELAKALSEENEGLLTLVRRTVEGLREMSGLERDRESGQDPSPVRDEFVMRPPQKSAEELASELEAIVEHLRSILTNPSFVPIEEVEVRDEAISRLRAGLETMEARWKDAVHMMDGWRRRMVSSGQSVDMEDLQMGLRLSPVRVRDVEETANVEPMRLSCVQEEDEEEEVKEEEEEKDVAMYDGHRDEQQPQRFRSQSPVESLRLVPAPRYEAEELGDDSDSDSSIFQDDIDVDHLDVEEPNVQILQISTADSIDSSPLPEPPQLSPLKDSYSSGNRGAAHSPPYRKGSGDFTIAVRASTPDLAIAAAARARDALGAISHTGKPASPKQTPKTSPQTDDEDALPSYTASYDSPLFGKSGERPSQAQLNRKLFSKPPVQPSEPRARNLDAGTGQNRGGKASSPPMRTRSTRLSAKKSPGSSPTSNRMVPKLSIRTVTDTHSTAGTSTTAISPSPSTATSATAASQHKQAAELAPRDKSANSSLASSPLADSKYRNRSPARAQPAAPSSSSLGSRLPRPHVQQSPLNMATIAAKLAASEREADAARVRAKLKAVRRNRRVSGEVVEAQAQGQGQGLAKSNGQERTRTRTEIISSSSQETAEGSPKRAQQPQRSYPEARTETTGARAAEQDVDPVKRDWRDASPAKKVLRRRGPPNGSEDVDELALGEEGRETGNNKEKKDGEEGGKMEKGIRVVKRRGAGGASSSSRRTSKAASRRRSTLSPWELQGLITGNVGDVESPVR